MSELMSTAWVCYGQDCPKKGKTGHPVLYVSNLLRGTGKLPRNLQFLCDMCLNQAVTDGRLKITLAEPGADPATETTYTVPVSTADDGSVAVGDIEFRFD